MILQLDDGKWPPDDRNTGKAAGIATTVAHMCITSNSTVNAACVESTHSKTSDNAPCKIPLARNLHYGHDAELVRRHLTSHRSRQQRPRIREISQHYLVIVPFLERCLAHNITRLLILNREDLVFLHHSEGNKIKQFLPLTI